MVQQETHSLEIRGEQHVDAHSAAPDPDHIPLDIAMDEQETYSLSQQVETLITIGVLQPSESTR